MQKISSPQDLQAELERLVSLCDGPERPSREVLASELNGLADRLGPSMRQGAYPPAEKLRDDLELVEGKCQDAEASIKAVRSAIKKYGSGKRFQPQLKNAIQDAKQLGNWGRIMHKLLSDWDHYDNWDPATDR